MLVNVQMISASIMLAFAKDDFECDLRAELFKLTFRKHLKSTQFHILKSPQSSFQQTQRDTLQFKNRNLKK